MNLFFLVCVVAAIIVSLCTGRGPGLMSALTDAAGGAVTLSLSLAGGYALWCGLLNVVRRAGLLDALARAMRRPLRAVFPGIPEGSQAAGAIAMNLAANALGVGNAATPAGLRAMEAMGTYARGAADASDDMIMFLCINCASVQLIPTTVIALRAAAGAAEPADILLPTLLSTACSAGTAVLLCKICAHRAGKRARRRASSPRRAAA